MATNILLNKTATASSYVMPYAPSKIVDGAMTPFNRWLCNTFPGWISIDAGAAFWVNRWVIKLMGNADWESNYNMSAYTLQTSVDNINWTTVDSVAGNTANTTDRSFATISARYFRISVSSGIAINTNLASIMEFEVYDAPAPTGLSALTVSNGNLAPAFDNLTLVYTVAVGSTIGSITFTPTATLPTATITVDDVTVASGAASQAITLELGETRTISIGVTTNGSLKTYTVQATRGTQVQTSAFLSKLELTGGGRVAPTLSPSFVKTTFSYTGTASATPISIGVTTEDPAATLYATCNGVVLTANATTYSVPLNAGNNSIVIKVTSTSGFVNNYIITITKS
ncbi:MAG: coagulation factor 5/8 type domain protein [Bacteroidetes bacterium]|nr:coagulation factor 5/8 type domain protein [Bacteroidota bacterium]